MASVQVVTLDPVVLTVVQGHQKWMRSTHYKPFRANAEVCTAVEEMRKQGDALAFYFRSRFWKFDQNNQAVGDRSVTAFRFTGETDISVDAGCTFDVIPVTGPIRLNNRLVRIGEYAHIDQDSFIEAVSPPDEPDSFIEAVSTPDEPVRCCWLYMYREGGKSRQSIE